MPIYDWNAPDSSLHYAKIYDANGLRITNVLDCDTDTGYVHRLKVDDAGEYVIDEDACEPVTVEEYHAAPLLVVFDKDPPDRLEDEPDLNDVLALLKALRASQEPSRG